MELWSSKTKGNQEGDMSIQESLKVIPKGDVALLEWDHVGASANKLSTPIMTRFVEILEELKTSSYKAAVIISRKKKIFIAGADIEEIKNMKTKENFRQAVEKGQGIMNMIEDLPIPVVAAIHGACMGGGCEMILACDYRVASEDKSTKIGLPEVKLGIIPGSMTALGFIVKGLGNTESINSASHGAGRLFSRRKCKEKFTKSDIKQQLKMNDVSLIGGGIDEAPMAYKNIKKVMANQQELVEVLGTFTPKIVRMDK